MNNEWRIATRIGLSGIRTPPAPAATAPDRHNAARGSSTASGRPPRRFTFTINYNATYQDRWDSLMQAIQRAADGPIWTETTSFVLLKSSRSASDLLNTIYYGSLVTEASGDKLVVIGITRGDVAQRGVSNSALLGSFFPSRGLGNILVSCALRG